MKRLVKFLFFAGLILAAVLLAGPNFVDWNQHKGKIASVLEKTLGAKVEIAGNVNIKALPQPHVLLEDVSVGGAALKLKRLDVHIRLAALLEGRIEAESIRLDAPQLVVEIAEDGTSNWPGAFARAGEKAKPAISASAVRLNSVTVSGGTLRYSDQRNGAEFVAENIDLGVSADTLLGPFRVKGSLSHAGRPVTFTIGTKAYDSAAALLPLKAELRFSETLPPARFDGVFSLPATLQGVLKMNEAVGIALQDKPADVAATLVGSFGDLRFTEINATFEGGGSLTGNATWLARNNARPSLSVEFEGKGLSFALPKASPEGFDLGIDFKGEDITVDGGKLSSLTLAASASEKDWAINAMRAKAAGKSDVRVAGVMTPSTGVGLFVVQLDTEDIGKLATALPVAPQSALKLLAGEGPVKKLNWTSDLGFKDNNISLSNIVAKADDETHIMGGIDIARGAPKPAFVANLGVTGWHKPRAAGAALLQRLTKAEGALAINFKDYDDGALKAEEIKFSARFDGKGLELKELTGVLGENQGFDLSGRAASIAPLKDYSFEYGVKTPDGAGFAKAIGIPLPPPLTHWRDASLHGKIEGAGAAYSFTTVGTVAGGTVDIDGTFAPEEGYKLALHLSRTGAEGGFTGLPIERVLLAQTGAIDLAGTLTGTAGNYSISDIRAKLGAAPMTGSISLKEGQCTAALSVERLNLDKWRWNDWAGKGNLALTLGAKTLGWKGISVENPVLKMTAGEESVQLTSLTGKLWGGDLALTGAAKKDKDTWGVTLQGTATQSALDSLRIMTGLTSISVGTGNADIDIAWQGAGFLDNLADATGKVTLKTGKVSIAKFAPSAAAKALEDLRQPGVALQQLISTALKEKGKEDYPATEIPMVLEGGKALFKDLKLSGKGHTFEASASLDIASEKYNIAGEILFSKPEGAPAVTIHRSDRLKKDGDYGVDIRMMESWAAIKYASPQAEGNAVDGILQRLEGDDQTVR